MNKTKDIQSLFDVHKALSKGIKMSQSIASIPTSTTSTAAENAVSASATLNIRQRIEALADKREVWESTLYSRSNTALYSIFAECLALYRDLTEGDGVKAKKSGFTDYINLKGYTFKESSPLSLKVIRCVFGDKDRRRLSTYHSVLLVAIADKWDEMEVAQKIADRGGVQEISLTKPGGMTAKDKANAARNALMNQSIASLTSDAISKQFNTENIGDNAVAVLTLNSDGTYSVHCVVRSTTAVNAALTSYFSANKEALKGLQENKQMQDDEAQKALLISNAANDSQNQAAA
ncbi:MAG: hypothetical protein Q7U05_04890 [Polaromonas sp.]|nr:hypothetical protein [Polaromonas sp.]